MPNVPLPAWLNPLRSTPMAESGIHWHTEEEISKTKTANGDHLELYDSLHNYTDADLRSDAENRLARCVKVGMGAEGHGLVASARSFGMLFPHPAEFWFDPDFPETLFCSLNKNCPPHLWFPVGTTRESILAATKAYFPGMPPDPAETAIVYARRIRQQSLGREVPEDWVTSRFMLGMVGEMNSVENRFVERAAFCRTFDAIATSEEDDRIVPQTVFHTLQSFSRVRLEFHGWLQYDGQGGVISPVVANVTYPVCTHSDPIRVYNTAMDTDVPEQLPVDVLAALFGYPMKGLPRMYRVLGECVEPWDITYNLGIIVATEGHDPTLMDCLWKYAAHPAPRVRDRVGRYANMVGHPELAREILANEQDEDVRKTMRQLLGEE